MTAVRVFEADSANELEHDINEWMTDPSEHGGIVSVQYQASTWEDYGVIRFGFSALVHYVLP